MKVTSLMAIALFILAMSSASCAQSVKEDDELVSEHYENSTDLSGVRLRSEDPRHAQFYEEFRADGEWIGTFKMAGPVMLFGKWSQSGEKVCVDVASGEFTTEVIGQEVCRKITKQGDKLRFGDIRNKESSVPVTSENI